MTTHKDVVVTSIGQRPHILDGMSYGAGGEEHEMQGNVVTIPNISCPLLHIVVRKHVAEHAHVKPLEVCSF